MKKIHLRLFKIIPTLLLLLAAVQMDAQRMYSPLGESDFMFTINNDVQVNNHELEFDLYLLDMDPAQSFELAAIQAGILVNPAIYNGGTLSVAIVAGSSELVSAQQPYNVLWSQAQNTIKLTPRPGPGPGNGTIILTSAPGTRICRLRLTNTVSFTANSTADLLFNFTTSPYPTKVFQYIGGVNIQLVCNATNCINNAQNIILNPGTSLPLVFDVTGGGVYCENSNGLPVGLSGSEIDVTYTLFKDAVAQVPTASGTGAAISFGNQLFGTYTVSGTNIGGTTEMTGSAVITETATLPVSVSVEVDQNNVCSGTPVTLTATPVNGGNPAYQWYKNGSPVGSNQNSYAYTPENNDQVYVVMTSDLDCVSGNPSQSNTIQMQVSPYIDVTASIAITQNNLCEGSEFNFTSSTTGGGNTPQYQWQVNGVPAGENTPEFAYVAENGDVVSMVFTSDLTCTNGNPVTSNTISAVVNPLPVVTWLGFEPDTLCIEDWGPVTLTGGTPVGGTYTGDGVVDNIFDPAQAGAGTHEITYTYSDPNGCSNQSSLFLFVDVCLGMSEKESGLLVYPNPVSDNLMVKMQDNSTMQQITLTNLLGIRVYQNENPVSNEVVSIPVQNLPLGNYLLRVISDSKSVFKKVIIK